LGLEPNATTETTATDHWTCTSALAVTPDAANEPAS
jgi:hypothetical protein